MDKLPYFNQAALGALHQHSIVLARAISTTHKNNDMYFRRNIHSLIYFFNRRNYYKQITITENETKNMISSLLSFYTAISPFLAYTVTKIKVQRLKPSLRNICEAFVYLLVKAEYSSYMNFSVL